METSAKSRSPAPSTSEPKGFKGLVAKAKLGRKDAPSTTSLSGSGTSDEASERGGIRNSVDSLIDKARDSRGSSLDDGRPPGPSNLSKLIPGRSKKKRRKREEAEQQLQQDTADPRGRSADGQAATSAMPNALSENNESRATLGEEEGEDGGSLITIESNTEPTTTSPPPLVSHQSHIGYLTSSSPLITTTTHSEAPNNLQLDSPTFHNPQYQNSTTLPVAGSATFTNLATNYASTMESRDGGRNLSSKNGSRSRGVSPGARIKEVFTSGPKAKDSSPPKSPDRASVISSGSGNALQALFTKDKRNSMNLGRSSKASDSKESIASNLQSPSSSVRDLPIIVTTPNTPTSASLDPPETHVTPPTPIDRRQDLPKDPTLKTKAAGAAGTNSNSPVASSGSTIAHRRVRSDSGTLASSKLSNVMSAPLTPMAEERAPGARTPSQGSQAGGFFSSVFSAAQNAANQLSSTIANNQTRSRSSTQTIEENPDEQADGATDVGTEDVPISEQKKLAVETLGAGDLSLSHLGIGSDPPLANNVSTTTLPNTFSEKDQDASLVHREEIAAQAENASAARAVSQAYSLKPQIENASTPVVEDVAPVARPRSTYESSIVSGDKTPPSGSLYEGNSGFRRSGSVRSRVGTIAKRNRNSSSATGGTIAAAIAAGNAALANPSASGGTAKPTGFAVASKKRNRDFHQLFRSVPEDDYLIEDYSCALQRDIILAGRIYVSEGHICFSSNILGWVTTLIISFDEIVSVEKENTAMVFPNAIAIQTLNARQTFRSLLSREATYDLLIGIWKINHPSLKSSLNGVRLEGGTGDKTEKIDPSGSDASEASNDEDEIYDEDEDDEGTGSFTEVPEGSIAGSESVVDQQSKAVARKVSAMGVAAGAAAGGGPTPSESKAGEKAAAASAASADFPGPATHAPTECADEGSHYERPLQDDIIPAPLGKVYAMVFGAASGGFMAKWLLDDIKVTDLTMEDDKKGLSEESKTRNYSYIKPLNASIGPKTTKCVVTENLDSFDLEKAVSVTQSTQTPDVPSGNVFATKTHFCMMWAPGNATRLVINFTIEWTGKSWLKGPIEKGANEGQKDYCNELVKALKTGVTSRPRAGTTASKLKSKGKRRKADGDPARTSPASAKAVATGTQPKDSSWGMLEPLHGVLGPIVDIFSPMISSNMIIGFLLFVILINWFRGPPSRTPGNSLAYVPTSEKIAAYEEIWRKEESGLWDWLEERVGMQGMAHPGNSDREAVAQARRQREQSLRDKGLRSKLADVKMSEREVDHAIRVTEEKLAVLKRAIQGNKGGDDEMKSPPQDRDEESQPEAEVGS